MRRRLLTRNAPRSEPIPERMRSVLGIRRIYHQLEHRADAHILIAFLSYCLQATLKHRLLLHAPGLTPTAVLEKLTEIKMIDVWIPTVDQRWLILPKPATSELFSWRTPFFPIARNVVSNAGGRITEGRGLCPVVHRKPPALAANAFSVRSS